MVNCKLKCYAFMGLVWGMALAGCEAAKFSQIEVQRPAKLTVAKEVKRLFIKKAFIQNTHDRLGVRDLVLEQLKNDLNRFGRFQVTIVDDIDENTIDREKESFGVIQGEIISGGEVDRGQFSETAVCRGGLTGRLTAAGTALATDAVITMDSHLFVCKKGSITTQLVDEGLTQLLTLAGAGRPPINYVVRSYNYKNVSLFAQANFSLTTIGLQRETLAIRADAASFGRQVIDRDSYRNAVEGRPHPLIQATIQMSKVPVIPIVIREAAFATKSKPGEDYYQTPELPVPNVRDLPPEEKKEIIQQLVSQTTAAFIQTISPYKAQISAEIVSGGKANVEEPLKKGEWQKVKDRIEQIPQNQREAQDWYHLGLAVEGGAVTADDYLDAKQYYTLALEKDAANLFYAMGIGRMERRLAEAGVLKAQTKPVNS